MGTSSSNKGSGGKSSLLPEWMDLSGLDKNEIIKKWTQVKNLMTRFATTSNPDSVKNITKTYIQAHGGSENFSRSSEVSKELLTNFIGVANKIRTEGLVKTHQDSSNNQIDLNGKDIDYIFSVIIEDIIPKSNIPEETIAREAMYKTISDFIESISENQNYDLNNISLDDIKKIVELYLSNYILKRILYDLRYSFDKKINSPSVIKEKEEEFSVYISTLVNRIVNPIDVNELVTKTSQIIESFYSDCLKALEETL